MGAHARKGVFSLCGGYVLEKSISIVAAYSVVRFFTRLTQIVEDLS